MLLHITSLYAAILALGFMVLSNIVSAQRGKTHVSILHGDDMNLALWMRRHGNLAENLPLALILMAMAEIGGLGATWLHVMGIVLVLARISHAVGLSVDRHLTALRLIGGVSTQLVMLGAVVFLLWSQF